MCLILLAHRAHPDLPLVIAANRDERYDRPTRPAGFWEDCPRILAGRDLEAGGTWLGMTRQGRFAAVTNVRNGPPATAAPRSRGELTRDFLRGNSSPGDYATAIMDRAGDYGGFNLLLGDGDELLYCENFSKTTQRLSPGVYGLSNHLLDTPWPKVVSGKNRLTELLEQWHSAAQADTGKLLDILTDKTIVEDELLPDTGVGLSLERQLSPIFIAGEGYGTVCSTAVVVDRDGQVKFHERSFYGPQPRDSFHEFTLGNGLEP